eukprot:CAMPEP_0185012430 /NCGR_PEP_ID=MMETSP1098-20130426/98298_1 /TAXON_ID=89044 /ORGANISM="Spumella elongata, Strain CCAP 955/1" /LENGTH=521 /DNA_ID=CAMNT_0027541493 /DNA_START=222 /DNA_END=1787 /DNA_ORIENTATION=+
MGNCALVLPACSVAPKYSVGDDGIVTRNNSSEFSKKPLERRLTQNVIKENLDQDIREYYDIDDQPTLGSGLSGQVKLCVHKTTKLQYALKTLTKVGIPQDKLLRLRNELGCMAHLDHPNIIRVHEVFENDLCIYLVMELCKGGHLMDRLFAQQGRYYREKIACKYIHSILTAVAYCHANNVVHRDLKLENILFESDHRDSELKLIDFGLSQCFRPKEVMHKYVGTSYYVAPEVIDGCYDAKCDVWSIGVIAYMLLSGVPPFYGATDTQTLLAIQQGKWQFDNYLFANVSPMAKDFITKCLTKKPFWRPSAAGLLKHKWFRMFDPSQWKEALPSVHIIRRFGTHILRTTLAKIFMGVVAHTLLPEQVSDLRDQFNKFDVSYSGVITLPDLRTVMKQFKGYREDYLHIIVRNLDIDQRGNIGYHEFLAATIRRKHVAEVNLYLAFEKISANREFICAEDIRQLLGNTSYEVNKIMEEVGLDVDAKINYEEFKSILDADCEGQSYLDAPDYDMVAGSALRSKSC